GVFFDYDTTENGQNKLVGCFVGTTPDGMAADGSSWVTLRSWTNAVGGSAPADRNGIAGRVFLPSSKQHTITNKYLGTDASGTVALGVDGGVSLSSDNPFFATLNTVSGNLVSGNTGTGISIGGGSGNSVSNNLVGTDVTGTLPLGNGADGVYARTGSGMF